MTDKEKLKTILEILDMDINLSEYKDYEISSLLLDIEFAVQDYTTP